MHKRRWGIVCVALGAFCILAALGLFLLNQGEDARAGQAAETALVQLKRQISAKEKEGEASSASQEDLPMVQMNGNWYIGYCSIPALQLELPVLAQWNEANMKIAPCRYYGAPATNDFVIAGHNFRRHFGGLKGLAPGDLVFFVDARGKWYGYQVACVETLRPEETTAMIESDWDCTLFTCTYAAEKRIALRCKRLSAAEVAALQEKETLAS